MFYIDNSASSHAQPHPTNSSEAEQLLQKFELALNPSMKEEREQQTEDKIRTYEDIFGSLDMIRSYKPIFELLWYSTMPCFDVKGLTSTIKDEMSIIKRCYWKNRPISCAAIFRKHPTDRGICCSFNMEKADRIFKRSMYTEEVALKQKEESEKAFEDPILPPWYIENQEPAPEAGEKRGLRLVLDRHTDKLSPMSVTEDFQGFTAIIDDNNKFPMAYLNAMRIRPGMENIIKLDALRVDSDDEIRQYSPQKRNCYFFDEYKLEMHQNYTQANCVFECKIKFVVKCMEGCTDHEPCKCPTENVSSDLFQNLSDTCAPWFYPTMNDTHNNICNPWETVKFQNILRENVPKRECDYCLPDCITTKYDTSIAYAKFQSCDYTNIGSNELCNLINANMNPPSWADVAKNVYTAVNMTVPGYVVNNSTRLTNMRKFINLNNENRQTYDAFEEDIATLNIFFGYPYIVTYKTSVKMSTFEFIALVGGNVGLGLGISIISVVEIIYWITVKLFINYTASN